MSECVSECVSVSEWVCDTGSCVKLSMATLARASSVLVSVCVQFSHCSPSKRPPPLSLSPSLSYSVRDMR